MKHVFDLALARMQAHTFHGQLFYESGNQMFRCLSVRFVRQGGSFLKDLNVNRILASINLNCKQNVRLHSTRNAEERQLPPPSSKLMSSVSGPAALIALQQAGLQLPERCCGCGIRLQQADPEFPG
jgi:hypothetical protein